MLNDSELNDYFIRRNLSPEARGIVQRIRKLPPARRVGGGTKNVPCRFASGKMGCTIQAESHRNELPAVIAWEHDRNTFEFYDQPPKIKLTYEDTDGRRRAHLTTPDFFLLQQDFTGWVECKTEEWLRKHADDGKVLYVPDGPGRWRCPPGEEYAAAFGLGFRVRSSTETNWTAVRNAEFLSDYLHEQTPPATPKQLAFAAKVLEDQAWIWLKDLLEAGPELPADAIFTMIARGQLHVDLAHDLLTHPEKTPVFRDALAAKVYRANLESSQVSGAPDLQAVNFERGQQLLWDGRLMHILNVGDNDVFLEDESRVITPVQRSDLVKLVRSGTVRGLSSNLPTKWKGVEEALSHASLTDIEEALKRYYSIFPERADGQIISIGGERAKRNWRAAYRRSAETVGYGLVGLLPKLHRRGNRDRKLDAKVIEIMDNVIDELYAHAGRRKRYACWGEVRNRCIEAGLTPPGARAFRNQIARRQQYALAAAREGEKAAYDQEAFQWYLERTSPRHGERPFEIAHIDHTVLDLQFISARYGEQLGKAWLTVMIDGFTRMISAWVIHFEEPSYRSCMRVIRECIRRHNRIARNIVVDNGPDFQSAYFEKLLALLEVTKKSRPGGKPRYGSIVERVFGTTNNTFVHNLLGNNQALQNPRRMSKTHDPRRLAVWTLPEFDSAFDGYLDRVYHAAEHPALGMSPTDMMEVGLAQCGTREHRLIPYTQELAVWCLPSTPKGTAKVDPVRGVKIAYIYYWDEKLRDPMVAGKDLPVRYDPDDASIAFVWFKNREWIPCRSELAAEFQGCSEKEIQMATEELRARFKRDGERRAITASLIAEYLRSTQVTEQILMQRKRHRDSADTEDHDLKDILGISSRKTAPASQSSWAGLPLTVYGEFK